jgi:hypothetical protein
LKAQGWVLDRIKRNQAVYKNYELAKRVPIHGKKVVNENLYYAILKRCGKTKNESNHSFYHFYITKKPTLWIIK